MKQNYIKFRKESVQLARIFASAHGNNFCNEDIEDGALVIGTYGNGKFLAMGWLRGMTQDKETGKVFYEVVNAVDEDFTVSIEDARRVDAYSVPVLAARLDCDKTPFIGRAFACNGEKAKLANEAGVKVVSTEFIYRLEPLFKETN